MAKDHAFWTTDIVEPQVSLQLLGLYIKLFFFKEKKKCSQLALKGNLGEASPTFGIEACFLEPEC